MELARVRHPLVDQDETRPILVKNLAERIAGAGRALVVPGDARVRGSLPQLPGELAPQGADDRAVGLGGGIARRNLVADQNHPLRHRQAFRARFAQHGVDADQLARWRAGEQVVQGKHRMRLAAAEVGLQLHDRVAAPPAEPAHRTNQHRPEAFGEVGAAEELDRVPILCGAFAKM